MQEQLHTELFRCNTMVDKILIVDDERDFCEIMKNYFTRKGYSVQISPTLASGLEKVREYRPEILFLDNNLPDGQGWEAVDEIVELIPQSRVFLISAHKNKFPMTNGRKSYNITIWEKPISLRTLDNFF